MNSKLADKLSILQANDHFRGWHTLDDERVCAICDRKFSGNEVVILISLTGDDVEVRCPTPDCQSRVHQWVHPANPHLYEKSQEDWWDALSSNSESDNTGSAPSPQPV